MADNKDASNTETRLALIEREVGMVNSLFQKFEVALEKMTEVSSTIQKILAVHDQKIQERERAESMIMENVERRRDEYVRHAERATQKMEEIAKELREQVKEELTDLGTDVKASLQEMKETLKANNESVETKMEKVETRVRDLERWRWLIAGGGVVVGFIVAKWPMFAAILGVG